MNRSLFARVATQVARGVGVSKTPRVGLARKTFTDDGQKITAIQQNPRTGSSWAGLAQQGHDVVQFKDESGKYIAVSVDGKVTSYNRR